MPDRILIKDVSLALVWEARQPIPFNFWEPLKEALEETVRDIYQHNHPTEQEKRPYLICSDYGSDLGKALEHIVLGRELNINPWDYFQAAHGSWWQGGPIRPIDESYFTQLKANLRRRFGEQYDILARNFATHFNAVMPKYQREPG